MKKLFSLCLVFTSLTMLGGCVGTSVMGKTDLEETAQSLEGAENTRIAVICKALDSEFWLDVKRGAEDAAQELGVSVDVMAPETESDVDGQFKIIEDAILENYNVLAVAPCDSSSAVPVFEKAANAGVKVLTVDTDVVDPSTREAFIGTDNMLGGQLAAERMAVLFKDKPEAKIAMITGVLGQKSQLDRANGFKKGLSKAGMSLTAEIAANSDPAEAFSAMEILLVEHPDLDGVFVLNSTMALGVIEAIEIAEADVKLVGFDSSSEVLTAVQNGSMDSLIAQNPYNMGKYAVEAAVKVAKEESVSANVDTETALVTIENLKDYLD